MTAKEILLNLNSQLKIHLGNMKRVEFHVRDHSIEWESTICDKWYLMELSVHEYRPFRDYFKTEEKYKEFKNLMITPDWNKYISEYPEVKEFILENYSYNHLTQRQLSRLSGIPQQTIFAIIKHMKLKHVYPDMQKKDRVKLITTDDNLSNIIEPKPKLPISRKVATKKKWKKKK